MALLRRSIERAHQHNSAVSRPHSSDNNFKIILINPCSIAAACWSIHYAKRLLETVFVHRFSHATMPLLNLFKNCSYYWGFTAYVAYHVNHPLFTSPCMLQVYGGLAAFLVSFCYHRLSQNLTIVSLVDKRTRKFVNSSELKKPAAARHVDPKDSRSRR